MTEYNQPTTPQPQTRTARALFWPGFALGFLLLATLSCGGLFMASGLRALSLADLQPGVPAWTPRPVTATPLPAQQTPLTPAPSDALFAPGVTAVNVATSRVIIRRALGYLGKGDDDILTQMQPGDTVQILAGPESADNLDWWRILYAPPGGSAVEGWVAEATASGVTILGRP